MHVFLLPKTRFAWEIKKEGWEGRGETEAGEEGVEAVKYEWRKTCQLESQVRLSTDFFTSMDTPVSTVQGIRKLPE